VMKTAIVRALGQLKVKHGLAWFKAVTFREFYDLLATGAGCDKCPSNPRGQKSWRKFMQAEVLKICPSEATTKKGTEKGDSDSDSDSDSARDDDDDDDDDAAAAYTATATGGEG